MGFERCDVFDGLFPSHQTVSEQYPSDYDHHNFSAEHFTCDSGNYNADEARPEKNLSSLRFDGDWSHTASFGIYFV
jgi:hypothetical protein